MTKATDELREIEEKPGMLKFVREVDSSKKLYESFLQRVKETNEAQNLQVSGLKIIEVLAYHHHIFSKSSTKFNYLIFYIFFYNLWIGLL